MKQKFIEKQNEERAMEGLMIEFEKFITKASIREFLYAIEMTMLEDVLARWKKVEEELSG